MIKEKAQEILGGEADAVLGYRMVGGACVPHLFDADDVGLMVGSPPAKERYPLASVVRRIQSIDPGMKLAVVVRGCDERALVELAKQGQVDMGRLFLLGLACDAELARGCGCREPYPSEIHGGERVQPAEDLGEIERLEGMTPADRLAYWLSQFRSCIKCQGCRYACPLCYCNECALESEDLVRRGEVPPSVPLFHLIRAVDMAARCVDCGLCEEACPMGIPLRTLYRKVGRVVEDRLGYRPGRDIDEKSPLSVLGTADEIERADREISQS